MTGPIDIVSADDPAIAAYRNIRERDLVGRDRHFIAEGTVVLRMLLAAHHRFLAGEGPFRLDSVLLLKNRLAGLAGLLGECPADIPLYVAEQDVLSEIAGFHLHRGVLALGRRESETEAGALIAGLGETALVVVACGISNHDNMGAIFRNAAAFGASAIFLDGLCCDPLYRKALRVSVGSVLSVPYAKGGGDSAILSELTRAGFQCLALSPSAERDIRVLTPHKRLALVVGTEGEGLPDHVLRSIETCRIPQAPGLDSLNAGVATGIALYEAASRMGLI